MHKKNFRWDSWDEENVYNEEWRESQVEGDAMEPWEDAFMEGWDEAL